MTTSDRHRLDALDAIYQRRATRAFTPERVEEASIRDLLRAAVHAPTAMHLEPWKFVIIQDAALLKRISDRAKVLAAAPHHELTRAADAPHRPGPLGDPSFNIFYNAGTLIVICAKSSSSFATADCWLAAENLMLSATAVGLATCPIGFAATALADPEIKAELAIPPEIGAVAAIIVGRPAAALPATSRREPEILSWKK